MVKSCGGKPPGRSSGRLQGDVRESEILIDALLALIDQRVVALPIHDALVAPSSKVNIARKAMLDVFKEQMGVEGLVSIEGDR